MRILPWFIRKGKKHIWFSYILGIEKKSFRLRWRPCLIHLIHRVVALAGRHPIHLVFNFTLGLQLNNFTHYGSSCGAHYCPFEKIINWFLKKTMQTYFTPMMFRFWEARWKNIHWIKIIKKIAMLWNI